MDSNTLCCDKCGRSHRETPIIEKPKRFGYKAEIHYLGQTNLDGRIVDNICISCLTNEMVDYCIK